MVLQRDLDSQKTKSFIALHTDLVNLKANSENSTRSTAIVFGNLYGAGSSSRISGHPYASLNESKCLYEPKIHQLAASIGFDVPSR